MAFRSNDILTFRGIDRIHEPDEIEHVGVKRRSGRYPWGSGKEPYQHSGDFLARVDELKKNGLTESEISKSMGMKTTEFRVQKSLASTERREMLVRTAKRLRDKEGMSLNQIAKEMGFKNDSSVRSLLSESTKQKEKKSSVEISEFLKKQIEKKGIIDVGTGVERELNISKEKLKEAIYILEREGYVTYKAGVPQATNPGKQTNLKVLCKPGTEYKDIYSFDNIHSITEYSAIQTKDGLEFRKFHYPESLDSKRLKIAYQSDKDGLIEVRPGVADLSLGKAGYSQGRMLVDNKSYLKGMFIYGDEKDFPKGVDVIFNTNKKEGTPIHNEDGKKGVLKAIKLEDPSNPFGALIKANGQDWYKGKDGKEHLGLINRTRDEGEWGEFSKNLPAQFLSKQNISLVRKQLSLTKADKKAEFDEIMTLTNPSIKKQLLMSFSEDCDAAAVHLKAVSLPRQKIHVFIPVPTLKDDEIYAPNYNNGEKVAVIRFPHGGTFEIPILTVNNKHPEGRKLLKNAKDAIGLNKKVLDRLSGADCDGDFGIVVPTHNGKVKITSTPPLKGLEGFDPKDAYPGVPGMRKMTKGNTQMEMGKISNLITDMSLKGASDDEMARAVRHSMVVIDAEKHGLNYKKSEIDNNIAALKEKYQSYIDPETGKKKGGAGTIVSRARGQVAVLKRQGSPIIDPDTGKLSYKLADDLYYTDKNGKIQARTQKSTRMMETDDARTLSSGHPIEELYASYANAMKDLANQARKAYVRTKSIPYSPEAKIKYADEVASLNAKLNLSLSNAPKERQAQIRCNAKVKAIVQDNPGLDKSEIKKISNRELMKARVEVGAQRNVIDITDREWMAIQEGAISGSKLDQIVKYADADRIRELATPRSSKIVSPSKISRIKTMASYGYTQAEISKALGISTSTVSNYL